MITSDMWIEIQLPYEYYVYYELDVCFFSGRFGAL